MIRDIKPENFLIEKFSLKNNEISIALTDFGLAKTHHQTMTQTGGIGTIQYMAPEVYQSQAQSYSVDTWSCGIILYQLLSGDMETNVIMMSAECGKAELPNALEKLVKNSSTVERSQTLIDLMKQMIQIDPPERITPEKAKRLLEGSDNF